MTDVETAVSSVAAEGSCEESLTIGGVDNDVVDDEVADFAVDAAEAVPSGSAVEGLEDPVAGIAKIKVLRLTRN